MNNTWRNLQRLLQHYLQKVALEKIKKVYHPPRSLLRPSPPHGPHPIDAQKKRVPVLTPRDRLQQGTRG